MGKAKKGKSNAPKKSFEKPKAFDNKPAKHPHRKKLKQAEKAKILKKVEETKEIKVVNSCSNEDCEYSDEPLTKGDRVECFSCEEVFCLDCSDGGFVCTSNNDHFCCEKCVDRVATVECEDCGDEYCEGCAEMTYCVECEEQACENCTQKRDFITCECGEEICSMCFCSGVVSHECEPADAYRTSI